MEAVSGIKMNVGNIYAAKAKSIDAKPPKLEAFQGEGEMLMGLYKEYMKNVGGFQMIDGRKVHVTTVLHRDPAAQAAVIAIERRLSDLGLLNLINNQQNQIVY